MNIRNFDLNLLRALDALLETASVTAASRRLGLTQPAASAALARLRHALGDPLLVREGNRMSLSSRAERLAPRVRLLMAELEQALGDERFDPTRSERNFRIAATDDAIEILITPVIERTRAVAPQAQFEIVGLAEDVERDLAHGVVDIAVGGDWWLRRVRQREPRFTDRYVVLSAERRRLGLAAYARADHVLVAPHGRRPGTVDIALRKRGMSRRVSVTVPDFASAARLAASRPTLVATMPGRIAAHYAQHYSLQVFDPPLALPSIEFCLAASLRSRADPAVRWLMAQIRSSLPSP
jgi:DNA-binding transcriptional LysR family regulator